MIEPNGPELGGLDQPVSSSAYDPRLELLHWRRMYPHMPFFKAGLRFERYAPTFLFGYRTFLLNHRKSAEELCPGLCHQYKDGVAACDRIDWAEAQLIVAATWQRLRGADDVLSRSETVRTDRRKAPDAPSPRFHRWNFLPARPPFLHAASTAPRQAAAL
ncbi:MAG: hypothetical protein ABWZ08_05030 [Pseudoxanthomonas sp.]